MRVTALAKGAQVMFHLQPLHLLPGLGIIDEALQKLRPSWLAAGLLLNAGCALAQGGQVMFCPQPLLELPLPSVPRPAAVGKCLQHPPRKCLNEAWRMRNGAEQAS